MTRMIDGRAGVSKLLASLLAVLVLGAAAPAKAEDGGGPLAGDWQATLTLYGWLVSLEGAAVTNGFEADIDVGAKTVLENLDGALMSEFRVYKGNLGVFVNGVYGRNTLDANGEVNGVALSAAADIRLTFLDFGASWRFDPIPIGPGTSSVALEPFIGGRYTNIDLRLKLNTLSLRERYEFTDPLLGLRTTWELGDSWRVVSISDIGGFGVGSDLAWSLVLVGGYDFGLLGEDDATAFLGYRALGQDFSEDGGATEWDVITHGPMLGLALRF